MKKLGTELKRRSSSVHCLQENPSKDSIWSQSTHALLFEHQISEQFFLAQRGYCTCDVSPSRANFGELSHQNVSGQEDSVRFSAKVLLECVLKLPTPKKKNATVRIRDGLKTQFLPRQSASFSMKIPHNSLSLLQS